MFLTSAEAKKPLSSHGTGAKLPFLLPCQQQAKTCIATAILSAVREKIATQKDIGKTIAIKIFGQNSTNAGGLGK